MLYALALGFGETPTDQSQLRFAYENGLQAVPTMAVTLGVPLPWSKVALPWYKNADFEIDWKRMLHGEERLELFAPIPVAADILGLRRFGEIVDRGEKGAALLLHRDIIDRGTGVLLARTTSTMILRGDGGCGGSTTEMAKPHIVPNRSSDAVVEFTTLPQNALLYRLCGDINPLHADPAIAAAAGFKQPILHGLCSFGFAGRAILETACGFDPARLQDVQARFTSPVYPGETLRIHLWNDGPQISFRVIIVERDIVAIDNGRATVRI
jgi:acyl dehydratase